MVIYYIKVPPLLYNRFSGFRSLWAIFISWRYLTAKQISLIICAASVNRKAKLIKQILFQFMLQLTLIHNKQYSITFNRKQFTYLITIIFVNTLFHQCICTLMHTLYILFLVNCINIILSCSPMMENYRFS